MTDTPKTPMQGSSTLLSGRPGSGKTYALASAIEAGLKLAIVFTEPRGPESLIEALDMREQPIDDVHWRYISPASPSWETLKASAKLINQFTFEGLSKMKAGIGTGEYGQFIELINALADFTCDRTGEVFGPVDELDTSWMVVLDGISGVNIMAMDLVVGSKPTKAIGEWGVAMDNEERLLLKLTTDIDAHLCVITHIERETDELTGGTTIQVSALGRKLAPRIPRFFSDHVYCYRAGKEFFWSTAEENVDTKMRLLPIAQKIEPSFVPLIAEWQRRKDIAEATEAKAKKSTKGVVSSTAAAS